MSSGFNTSVTSQMQQAEYLKKYQVNKGTSTQGGLKNVANTGTNEAKTSQDLLAEKFANAIKCDPKNGLYPGISKNELADLKDAIAKCPDKETAQKWNAFINKAEDAQKKYEQTESYKENRKFLSEMLDLSKKQAEEEAQIEENDKTVLGRLKNRLNGDKVSTDARNTYKINKEIFESVIEDTVIRFHLKEQAPE